MLNVFRAEYLVRRVLTRPEVYVGCQCIYSGGGIKGEAYATTIRGQFIQIWPNDLL